MSNVLQFSLGLASGGFLSALGTANARVKGFLGSMIGMGAITAGVWGQIEKGAALKKLSEQTGESVGGLFRLQKALQAVDVDSSLAGRMLFSMQRALGGVSEAGEPTSYVFAQMGLDLEKLKTMGGAEAMVKIAGAMGKLNQAGAASAASKIFGREGAREFLAVARNAKEFAEVMKSNAVQAAIFQRYAGTFERLEKGIEKVKGKLGGIFLGVAAGIAPALQNVIEMLEKVDLSDLGAKVGTFITAITQAFREGKLSELIGDSLKLGFDAIVAYAPGVFEKVGYLLLKALETPLTYIQAGMEFALNSAAHKFATSNVFKAIVAAVAPGAAGVLGALGDTGATTWKDTLEARKKEGIRFDVGTGEFGLGDINEDANKRLSGATDEFKKKWATFWGEVTGFATRAPKPQGAGKGAGEGQTLGAAYKVERTELEKMGFAMRGGAGGDPMSDTARNTGKMVGLLERLIALKGVPSGTAPMVNV